MKKRTQKNLIVTLLIVLALCLTIGLVYAFFDFSVTINYIGTADTDYISIDGESYYKESPTASISISSSNNDGYLISDYDLLVYSSNSQILANHLEADKLFEFANSYVLIFENLSMSDDSLVAFSLSEGVLDYSDISQVIVLPKCAKKSGSDDIIYKNSYIDSFLAFKLANNQNKHNSFFNGSSRRIIAKCLYFINSFTIDEEIVFSSPVYINLLDSNVTLQEDLNIRHSYGGAFTINKKNGSFVSVNNTKVYISVPNGYYNGYFTEELTAPIVVQEYVDLTQNALIRNELLNEAANYGLSIVPNNIYSNVLLPLEYNYYGIKLSFELDDIPFDGTILRTALTGAKTLKVTASIGNNFISKTKIISIIGTSDLSKANALALEIDVLFKAKYALVDSQYIFNQDLILNSLVDEFKQQNGLTELSLIASDVNGTTFTVTDGVEILKCSTKILDGSTLSLISTVGSESVTKTYVLDGMTRTQANTYVESLMVANPYMTYSSDEFKLLNIKNNGFYLGSNDLLKTFTLGYTSVEYAVVEATNINSIGSGVDRTSEVFIDDTTDFVLSMQENFSVSNQLFLIQTLIYDGGSYDIVKQVTIPTGGVGGNQYTDYVGDNAYSEYFDSLTDSKLIDSVANQTALANGTTATAYTFVSPYLDNDIVLFMKLDDVYENEGNTFCQVLPNGEGGYQIDINADYIPSNNIGVVVICKFYYYSDLGVIDTDISNSEEIVVVSEQEYSFVIPGIYRCGNKVTDQFKDRNFYSLLVANYDNYDETYLYSDGVREQIASLDLTSLSSQQSVDISGIEYFINTSSIDLSGVNILTLSPFAAIDSNNQIHTLNLSNCGLVDNEVQNYLKSLTMLTSLDISNNSLTNFKYNNEVIFYRRLKTLNASSQTNLRTIDGLDEVVELETMDLSNNAIDEFSTLKKMVSLSSVKLFGNVTSIDETYSFLYGTSGKVNVPIFVDLITNGITIYANSESPTEILTTSSSLISIGEFYCALDLNAIVISSQASGNIELPSTIENTNETSIVYVLKSNYELDEPFATLLTGGTTKLSGTNDSYQYTTTTKILRVILRISKTINSVDYYGYREFIIDYSAI